MNSQTKPLALVLSTTLVVIAGLSAFAGAQTAKKAKPVTYKQVQAIFTAKCINCHKAPRPRAQMNLESYAGVIKGNDDGSVITAGHPEKSLIYQLITSTGRKQMPPGKPLTKPEVDTIGAWIKAGAKNK
jgi:uncharacterized membrane protein